MPDISEQKAFMGELTQAETGYVPLSITTGKACANCRWFLKFGDCYIVEDEPEPILATAYCNRWEASAAPVQPDVVPIPVTIVEPPMAEGDSGEMEMALPTTRRGLKTLIVDMFKRTPEPNPEQAFSVMKGKDGQYFWLARHTGKFIDREDEIITDKAHEEYVERVQKGLVPMPELWTWHKKGTMHGQADAVWKTGGFVMAFGHFTGTPDQIKQAATYYQKMGDKIKLSHMFKYPKQAKRGKVYHAYNTVEITTLPDGAEAFPYTSYEVNDMTFTKEIEDMIRGIGGDDMVKRAQSLDAKALPDTKALEAAGVNSKTLDNFTGSTIPTDDGYEALKAVQVDIDTRLKRVEGLSALITALDTSVKSLTAQLTASQQAANDALAKANANEKALLEYQAVAPPASKSNDTLLGERDKSFMNSIIAQAKVSNSPSLIDQFVGGQTTTVTGV